MCDAAGLLVMIVYGKGCCLLYTGLDSCGGLEDCFWASLHA
jgi:hypothetical protein